MIQIQHETLYLAVEPVDLCYFACLANLVFFLCESIQVDYEDDIVALTVDGCSVVVVAQKEIIYRRLQANFACGSDGTELILVL